MSIFMKAQEITLRAPKALLGLGNPGTTYKYTRHNIGFLVLDALAERHGALWRTKDKMELAQATINGSPVMLIKPQTYMNSSGQVYPFLAKQGVKAEDILVVHDELEFPFGKLGMRVGGSARGHNGLKSLISMCGENFARLRFGIGRPEEKEEVPNYVLQNFKESNHELALIIDKAVDLIEKLYV
jgi:PTH1 family peptidyl-tRNA hydrolase